MHSKAHSQFIVLFANVKRKFFLRNLDLIRNRVQVFLEKKCGRIETPGFMPKLIIVKLIKSLIKQTSERIPSIGNQSHVVWQKEMTPQ